RVPCHDAGAQPGRMIRAEHRIDSAGEGLLREGPEVDILRIGRRPAIERRELAGGDRFHGGPGELSLPGGPPQRGYLAFRAVDAHDNAGPPAVACSVHRSPCLQPTRTD